MKLQWKMLRRGQNSEIEGIIKFMKEQCIRYVFAQKRLAYRRGLWYHFVVE